MRSPLAASAKPSQIATVMRMAARRDSVAACDMSSGFSCKPIKRSPKLALLLALGVFLALLAAALLSAAAAQGDLAAERARMVTTIAAHAKRASTSLGREVLAPEILKVVGDVPRHEFVPDGLRGDAYEDRPLPIGYGQTISQPFIVALMTDLLRIAAGPRRPRGRAPARATRRRSSPSWCGRSTRSRSSRRWRRRPSARLQRLRATANVATCTAATAITAGRRRRPFDGIIVTAAAAGGIPPPLLDQLKPGGRMVIPVGARLRASAPGAGREDAGGTVRRGRSLPVAFVPLDARPRQR